MFEFTTTTHHFYSKRIIFYSVVVRIFLNRTEGQYFCGTKQFQNCQKELIKFGKKREGNVYFSDIGFFIRSWRPNPRLAAAGQFSPQIEKVSLFTSSTQSPTTSSPSRLKCTGHRIAWFYFFPWFLPSCWCCCHYKMKRKWIIIMTSHNSDIV